MSKFEAIAEAFEAKAERDRFIARDTADILDSGEHQACLKAFERRLESLQALKRTLPLDHPHRGHYIMEALRS